jgi:hypothetical protein
LLPRYLFLSGLLWPFGFSFTFMANHKLEQ